MPPPDQSPVLITGAAGFIGFHLATKLLQQGRRVVGLDNLSDYYCVELKRERLKLLTQHEGFAFQHIDLADRPSLSALFAEHGFKLVFNLAAQAGVRYSLTNPHAYVSSNLDGFVNVLEACRQSEVAHLVFASSSSVYGAGTAMPFSTHQNVDHPLSVYAATKKANELLAHAYAHLYRLPCTGVRFFTVYGPWGRPDMAVFLFTKAILAGEPIEVFNHGEMKRDFTYIDDVVEALARLGERPAAPNLGWDSARPDPSSSNAPYKLYNIGNNAPIKLTALIAVLERAIGKKAIVNLLPMQPGDVPETFADVEDLARDVGFAPSTPIDVGVGRFVRWYRDYCGA